MPKQLTAQTATITTAAVEVKTLTVSGKQVTLAVFRQLREEPLIADDGTLNGVPWGYVNYHPDKCEGSHFAHRHIVWQQGSEIVRARLNRIPDFADGGRDEEGRRRYKPESFHATEGNRHLTGLLYMWLLGKTEKLPLEVESTSYSAPDRYSAWLGFDFKTDFIAYACATTKAMAAVAARLQLEFARSKEPLKSDADWAKQRNQEDRDAVEAAEKAATETLAALQEEVHSWPTVGYKALRDAFKQACEAEAERRQRHWDQRAALADLPQLFIAV